MAPEDDMRLDELARRAGVATTTVRLYQAKGLLPGPRLVGRTGYYGEPHLTRLALIGKLQDQGFSLAGIGRLLETVAGGGDLGDLVGVEQQLDVLLARRHEVVLEPAELAAQFPAGMLTPEVMRRAVDVGVVELTDDGRLRVPDQRFIETGRTLVELGVPAEVVLEEWARLVDHMDDVAARFVGVFETHLLPADWRSNLDRATADELAGVLAKLRNTAALAVAAALDASIAKVGRQRLAELVPEP